MPKHPIFPETDAEALSLFHGGSTYMGLPSANDCGGKDIAVMGIPFDASTSNRPGTRFGPDAIRKASKNLSWQSAFGWDYNVLEKADLVDLGNLDFDFGVQRDVHRCAVHAMDNILSRNCKCLALGGDHYISYPLLESLAKKHGPLALVQFDAHPDTWPSAEERVDHGTGFYLAVKKGYVLPEKSIQIGIRTRVEDPLGIEILDAFEAQRLGVAEIAKRIRDRVGGHPAYLTFDIDCLDPAFAPGTGTPVCGGFSTAQALSVLKPLSGLDFVGADIVEVSPAYDPSEITALAAANLSLYQLHLLFDSPKTRP